MEEQTGDSYQGSPYIWALIAAQAKVGKTTGIVANVLGAMPWQLFGGVVDKPSHFHIVTADASALMGAREFLLENCEMPKEALGYRVYNLEKDVRTIAESVEAYQHRIFLLLREVRDRIAQHIASEPGVHAVLVSSLTGFARAMERGLMGRPTGQTKGRDGDKNGKGYGSIDLWQLLKTQLFDLQDVFQALDAHVFWEGHLVKFTVGTPPNQTEEEKLAISGSAGSGSGFGFNVSHAFRIARKSTQYESKDRKTTKGDIIPGKMRKSLPEKNPDPKNPRKWPVDEVYFDTDVSGSFVANGRMVASRLERSEFDLTNVLRKLGYKTGSWKPGK